MSACERPATVSNWSPIDSTPSVAVESSPIPNTETPLEVTEPSLDTDAIATAVPIPPIDLEQIPEVLPHLLKGYELVSWQSGEDWFFTLISGTNRQKTFEELISPDNIIREDGFVKITVSGVEAVKQVLERMPAGESVAWSGMNLAGQVPSGTIYFSYPPQEIMDDLFALAKECGFNLYTLQESE